MAVFLVRTEEYYGGKDNELCVFRNENDGLNYRATLNKESVIEKFEGNFPTGKVFVVVSEEWFGGNDVKVFATQAQAEKYRDLPKFEPLDMMILEKDVV